ncbi:MAG TPA: regulatory iron-sulfur-containing complex subunit RicT [Capsulimonadaceae bacterium]|nr:regulatory iron-sulfur-containing complex subunit RicT [Capsulimonadaceae bacterium]
MTLVVGVTFKKLGSLYDFDSTEFPDLCRHDAVMVASGDKAGDVRFAIVEHGPRLVEEGEAFVHPLRPVLRRANPEDFARRERLEARQAEAHRLGQARIRALELPMKLIETECAEDGRRVTYHFVAEGRVDFRELVRDLAEEMRTHVMMHQVGPRDHARLMAAYGPCGRPTCCSTFLREFEQITVRMAKDQDLSLNPGKYSGVCGKLMCCLRYEHETYRDARARLPSVGMVVMTSYGRAKVMEVNVLQERLTVQLETQAYVEVRAADIGVVPGCVDHTEGGCEGGCGASAPLRSNLPRTLPMAGTADGNAQE